MKYQLELDLDVSRQKIIELFLDSDNLYKWQPDLVSFEHVSGEPRQLCAISKQVHKMGSKQIEMIETITKNNFPEEFSATYEAGKVWNLIENVFTEVSPNKTHWVLVSEFKCSGVMKLLVFLFPGMFKKQTFLFMKRFKQFAETGSIT